MKKIDQTSLLTPYKKRSYAYRIFPFSYIHFQDGPVLDNQCSSEIKVFINFTGGI